MRPLWRCWRAIVLGRPVFAGLMGLLYALVFLMGSHQGAWEVAFPMLGFATAGVFGLATERILRYGLQAVGLGIPRHEMIVNRVQLLMLVVFIGVPIAIVWGRGGPLLSGATVVVAAAAAGVLFAQRSVTIFALIIAGQVVDLKRWTSLPPVQVVLLAGAAYILWRWYGSPRTIAERRFAPRAQQPDRPLPMEGTRFEVDRAIAELRAGEVSPLSLGVGIGVKAQMNPVAALQNIAWALGAVLIWHLIRQSKPEYAAYFFVTGIAAIAVVSQQSAVYMAWRQSRAEQEMLLLMPRLPSRERLKRLFLLAVARTQVGPWTVWGAVSVVGAAVEWVSLEDIGFGAVILLAATCAASADIWLAFARRTVRQIYVPSIAIILCSIIGVVVVRVGGVWLGLAFILIPAVLAFTVIAVRPLQFPVTAP